jgi:hypothetical protein
MGKVSFIQNKIYFMKDIGDYTPEKTIKKRSKNIKELLEENDYVNGNKVVSINGELYVTDVGMLSDIEIKSILTHEQFDRECYKIGD